MRRRSFLIRAAVTAGAVAGGFWLKDHVIWRRPEVVFPDDGSSGWLAFVQRNTVTPTVRVRVGDREVTALVDTGAQYSVIDRALFQALGLTSVFDMPLVAYGVGGEPQLGRGVTIAVAVGAMQVEGLRAAILDLGPIADADGLSAPLILGRDILGEVVVDLDPRRRIRFVARNRHELSPAVRPVDVRREGTAMATEVSVEGAVLHAVVDTGASALLALSETSAQVAGLLDGRPQGEGSSIVLGGVTRARVVQARTVTFGDELWRGVAMPIYEDSPLPNYPRALLGMAAFKDRTVAIDIGGGRLYVSPLMDLTVGQTAAQAKVSQTAGSPL